MLRSVSIALAAVASTAPLRAQHQPHHLRHGPGGALHSAVNRLDEGSSFEVGTVDPNAPHTLCDGYSIHRRVWIDSYPDLDALLEGYLAPEFDATIPAVHGRRALKIDNARGDYVLLAFQPFQVAAGEGGARTFSAHFRTTTGGGIASVKLTIRNLQAPGERSDAIQNVFGDAWTRIAVTHTCTAGAWYEAYLTMGNYSQPQPLANGTLWVDAVQIERSGSATAFDYHTEAQEIAAFATDGAAPRAGNLFSSLDEGVRVRVQVFEESPLPSDPPSSLAWTLRDRDGAVRGGGSAPLQPSPTRFQELELADVDLVLDAAVGEDWRGWYRMDVDLLDPAGTSVDREEVVLARFEASRVDSRRWPRSPFGTHALESASGGLSAYGHVLELNQGLEPYFRLAASIGARWQRMNNSFTWALCNPAQGAYRYNTTGLELGARYGLTPIANTRAIPTWVPTVTSSLGKPIVAPSAWPYYEAFVDDLHHRFDDPGPLHIDWYEVENEPDHPYQPHYSPADYFEFLSRADDAAQAPDLIARPRLAGPAGAVTPLSTFANTWLDQLLVGVNGAYGALSAVTKHYYNWPESGVDASGAAWHQTGAPEPTPPAGADHPTLAEEIGSVRATLAGADAAAGTDGGRPLWFTEVGWFTPRNSSDVIHHHSSASATTLVFPGMSGSIDRAREAGEWLARTFVVALGEGAGKVFTLSLASPPLVSAGNTFGLVDHDLTPTVELTAYAGMTARLGPVPRFLRRIESSDLPLSAPGSGARAYLFECRRLAPASSSSTPANAADPERRAQRVVAVVWDPDGAPMLSLVGVALDPRREVAAFDMEGNRVALVGAGTFDLALTTAPQYVEAAEGVGAAAVASAFDVVLPAQLPRPTATLYGPADTKLGWDAAAASADVVAYRIYREGVAGAYAQVAEVEGRATSVWFDTSAQNNCSYRVSCVEAVTGREGPQSLTSACVLPP